MSVAADLSFLPQCDTASICVGRVVDVDSEGRPFVDFPGNISDEVVVARLLGHLHSVTTDPSALRDSAVLLTFDGRDATQPIIIGFLTDSFNASEPQKSDDHELRTRRGAMLREISLDGEKLVFEAKREIVFRCGKSSITLRKDGRILVKGTEIVSNAAEKNRIKGGSVAIN